MPPAVLVDAVSATAEGSGVLVFTALAVLDAYGDELLDSARAEVLVGTGVDVVMIPVVLDDVDASTPGLTAVADDGVLLLEAVDAEVEVLASPAVLEDVAFAFGKTSRALRSNWEQAWRPWHQSGFQRIAAGSLARSSRPPSKCR